MSSAPMARERLIWAAAVAILATTAGWLAAIAVVLVIRTGHADPPAALVALRAVLRVAWRLTREAGVLAAFIVLVPGVALMFARAMRGRVPLENGARHA